VVVVYVCVCLGVGGVGGGLSGVLARGTSCDGQLNAT